MTMYSLQHKTYILRGYTQHDEDIPTGDNGLVTMNDRPWVSRSDNRLHTSQLDFARHFESVEEAYAYLYVKSAEHEGNVRYQLHQHYVIEEVITPRRSQATGALTMADYNELAAGEFE